MSDVSCIFIVDDDEFILRSVERLFFSTQYEVETYSSARLFLENARIERPGCVILDISMPEMQGLELQAQLLCRRSLLPIIFLTGNGDVANCVRAMKQGACDFLTKPVDAHILLCAVEQALQLNRKRLKEHDLVQSIQARLTLLTPRERQVLEQVVAGRLNKQIAAEFGTVEHTIKLHRASIMRKMQAQSIQSLVTTINTLRLLGGESGEVGTTI
ncbi:response regulator [Methylobacillus gramineus]|nr:response regulator [Methylobacillus gramineus]